jgi:DNA-binding beta-propeller fold protein YncE
MKSEAVARINLAILNIASLVFLAGCGMSQPQQTSQSNLASATPPSESNPIPAIATISPNGAVPGGSTFTLTVNGINFLAASMVNFGGTARTTTFVSATQLTAVIPAAAIASADTAAVTVTNPAPGGGSSNAVSFSFAKATGEVCPHSVTVDPTGKFAYVANSGCGDFVGIVSMYAINATTGALTSIGSPVAADFGSYAVTVDPSGKFAYVANEGDGDLCGSVSMYTLNATTGALTSVGTIAAPGAPPPSPGSCSPYSVAVDRSGKFAYVANEVALLQQVFRCTPSTPPPGP